MMVASQWKISSSDRGPAEQEVGGSFCKSCLNSLRGAQEEEKCVDVVSWSAFAIQVRRTDEVSDEICLSREGTDDERTKEKKRKEEKCLHARNQKKRHRRDRQSLSTLGKKLGRMISVLETSAKTYHELFGDSFRSHFNVFLSLAIFFCLDDDDERFLQL